MRQYRDTVMYEDQWLLFYISYLLLLISSLYRLIPPSIGAECVATCLIFDIENFHKIQIAQISQMLTHRRYARPLNSLSSVQDYHKACRVRVDVVTTKDGGISRMLSKRGVPDSCCAIHTPACSLHRDTKRLYRVRWLRRCACIRAAGWTPWSDRLPHPPLHGALSPRRKLELAGTPRAPVSGLILSFYSVLKSSQTRFSRPPCVAPISNFYRSSTSFSGNPRKGDLLPLESQISSAFAFEPSIPNIKCSRGRPIVSALKIKLF